MSDKATTVLYRESTSDDIEEIFSGATAWKAEAIQLTRGKLGHRERTVDLGGVRIHLFSSDQGFHSTEVVDGRWFMVTLLLDSAGPGRVEGREVVPGHAWIELTGSDVVEYVAAFALNPTIAWANFGLGLTTEIRLREDIYFVAGLHDANGTPTTSGFETLFGDREFFIIGEVGYDPGYLSDGEKNPLARDYHVTWWHSDERKKAGRPDGWGFGATAQHPLDDLVPFFRYGYSDGGAALLKHLVMGGVTWTNAFDHSAPEPQARSEGRAPSRPCWRSENLAQNLRVLRRTPTSVLQAGRRRPGDRLGAPLEPGAGRPVHGRAILQDATHPSAGGDAGGAAAGSSLRESGYEPARGFRNAPAA